MLKCTVCIKFRREFYTFKLKKQILLADCEIMWYYLQCEVFQLKQIRRNSVRNHAASGKAMKVVMRRALCILLAAILLLSVITGCKSKTLPAANVYDDGRDRPSNCGVLQVKDGKLCSESGEPVMLRGVSSRGIATAESFINEPLFEELSRDIGVNVFRLALYTTGVGIEGYCTGADKDRLDKAICNGVEYARLHDMYAIIDWHVLRDGDPNKHIEDAKVFFAEMAEKFCDYNNVIYEICNEPNGVSWSDVTDYANVIIPIIRERDPDSVIIVGNPDWSKDLNAVMADPLEYDNIIYTFHFYAATHKDEWRAVVENASQNGLPIFVTEYGVTASSGGFPRELEEADKWIELLERENISHCMWSFANAAEPCSALKRTVMKYNGFTEEDYTETGLWLLDMIKNHGGQ